MLACSVSGRLNIHQYWEVYWKTERSFNTVCGRGSGLPLLDVVIRPVFKRLGNRTFQKMHPFPSSVDGK
jgi:hypothetical protein